MKKLNIIIILISISNHASGYLGPGVGGGVIAGILGVIVALLLLLIGIIYYPIKRMLKKKKPK